MSRSSGIDDTRKTVGGVWWDFDTDGDLDLFVANQEGQANALFRYDRGRFVDVAAEAGVSAAGRPSDQGGVGPSLADFDLDGDFDLFVANCGPSALHRRLANGRFEDVARAVGITFDGHATTSAVGDLNADGRTDLYVGAFLAAQPHYRDWLYLNRGESNSMRFEEALPELLLTRDASHGVQLIDFDGDRRLDLSLTNNDADGGHYLLHNITPAPNRAFYGLVTDEGGRLTRPGAEIRVFAAGTRRLLAAALVDSGSGYCSQNAGPARVTAGCSRPRGYRDLSASARNAPRHSSSRCRHPEPSRTTTARRHERGGAMRRRRPNSSLVHAGSQSKLGRSSRHDTWPREDPSMIEYHGREWGTPVYDRKTSRVAAARSRARPA